ncbi:MAG: caspase family protein [Anaerolineae bacterium]|nr:caspase family protein [Anaerolineae bacterium]
MSQYFEHGFALLIGVGTCTYSNWSLPVTVKDAQALRSVLIDANLCAYSDDQHHVRLLHDANANRQAIMDGLSWLKVQTEKDREATAIVYFSGHGWLEEKTGNYYLVPGDVNPFNITGTALSSTDFITALEQIQAKRLLVIIDSCHAQGMATAKDPSGLELPTEFTAVSLPKSIAKTLKQGEGRAVFTSSRGAQKSWIRQDNTLSIYTYHLIEALQGANNKPGDTLVRVSNLMNHLGQTVPQSAQAQRQAEQSPFFDMATEDFPISLLQGGKGLPDGGTTAVQQETAAFVQHVLAENSWVQDVRQDNSGKTGSQTVEAKDSVVMGVTQRIKR